MSKHFIRTTSRAKAKREYPGVYKIVKVTGGYMAFDYASDYKTWKSQK